MTPDQLKQLRHSLGLTQEQMAERIGVSLHGYRKWEQGQRQVKGAALKMIEMIKGENRCR